MHKKQFIILGLSILLLSGHATTLFAGKNHPTTAVQNTAEASDLIGRWDLTVDVNGKSTPAWLEVKKSGYSTLVGRFVGLSGSARPVSEITFKNGKFSFTLPPQWEQGKQNEAIEGSLTGNGIQGTFKNSNGEKFNFTGVKAPYLERNSEVEWAKPIDLFNGKNLSGWKTFGGTNQWTVKDGILTNEKAGANLVSEQEFMDFKLHVEFRYPEGSNSGIYLRGRYEVQIEDSDEDTHPASILYSGIYGYLTPNDIVTTGPGEWQTFDITLKGRMVTVVANGEEVICNQEIPGITGGALDSKEGEPGPIYLQGDHGPIEFRQIVITPAK